MHLLAGRKPKDIALMLGLGIVLFFTTLIFFGLVEIGVLAALTSIFQIPYALSMPIALVTGIVGVFILLWIYYRILKMQS